MNLVKLSDIFYIEYGNSLSLQDMDQDKIGIAFISSGEANNGIASFVKPYKDISPFEANKITVSLGGSVLETFLQEAPFYTSYHVKVLTAKEEMTSQEMLAYCTFIRANKYRYSYGRQANRTLVDLKIPTIEDVKKRIPKIEINPPSEKPYHYKNISLNDREWRPFTYEDIFDIEKGFYNKKPDMREIGDIPFIGATEKNNGVTFLYPADVINETSRDGSKEEASNIDSKIYSKGCVTFSNGGSIGNVFYQNLDFTCAHHVNPIYIKNRIMTPFIGLFLSVLMGLDKYRYSAFGRECRLDRLPKSKIKLPIDPEGNPDWQFMEYYIKALPYSSNLKRSKGIG